MTELSDLLRNGGIYFELFEKVPLSSSDFEKEKAEVPILVVLFVQDSFPDI